MSDLINGFGNAGLLAERAKKDENGNSLTLTIEEDKVTEIGGKSIGGGGSVSLTETTLGAITDENNNPILDANNEIIGDANSVTFVSGINGKNLLAQRSYEDEDGNKFKSTYAKKEEILPPIINGGTLTDAASITVENNALSRLSTTQSTLTLNVNLVSGEIANFAVEIEARANVTLTVTSTKGGLITILRKSIAGGDSLDSGKFYQITCVGDCWTMAEFQGSDDMFTEIGGRLYRIVTIGTQTWLAENLDFRFDDLVVGRGGTSSSEPRGNYYDNNSSSYGKYGILYNWAAAKYLDDNKSSLIPGWHVPTTDEWDALATAVGGASSAGTKLKSTTDWSSGAGTDDYGFSALPAGYYDGSFRSLGSGIGFWTAAEDGSNNAYLRDFNTSAIMFSSSVGKKDQYSIRLVKDV